MDLTLHYTRLATHNGLPKIDIPPDFFEEVQENYHEKFRANRTPESACHKSKHCRSRSHKRSKSRTTATPTTSATPTTTSTDPTPRAPSPRPAHSSRPTVTPHVNACPAAEANGTSEDEAPTEGASASTKPKQMVTRKKKDPRHTHA